MAEAVGRGKHARLGGALLALLLAAGCGSDASEPDANAAGATSAASPSTTPAPVPTREDEPTPSVTVTPTPLAADFEAVCVDGLADVDETMGEAIAAVRADNPADAQRLLQRAADDLDALAERADDEVEDGELADALEDYAAELRYGDDLDALIPAREQIDVRCLMSGIG